MSPPPYDSGFVPVGSPVAVSEPEPTELTLSVAPSTISGPTTVLSVTVQNAAPTSAEYLVLHFTAYESLSSLSIRPEGFAADLRSERYCRPNYCSWWVTIEPVAAGQSATGQFTVTFSGEVGGGYLDVDVHGAARGRSAPNATSQNSVRVPFAAG